MQTIEFMYDFGSPNAYLVHKVLPAIAERCGAKLTYVPILLGGVFKATNNQSPMQAFGDVKNKLAYQRIESQRFINRHNIPFKMNPGFPIMTLGLMRGAVFARGKPWESKYIDAVFDAMWVNEKRMDDPDVIVDVLTQAGLEAQTIMQATQSPSVKGRLVSETSEAVERGTFGSPTLFVGDHMFFGKDSLVDLEHTLTGS